MEKLNLNESQAIENILSIIENFDIFSGLGILETVAFIVKQSCVNAEKYSPENSPKSKNEYN